jgi:molybdate transport system permease protein
MKAASAAFAGIDRDLEAAASTLRQGPLSVFLRVTLPLAWPGILAGSLLAFARAMGEFGASLMVAGSIPKQTQTLSMSIYDAVQAGEDDQALLLVIVTSVVSVAILVLSNRLFTPRRQGARA